MRRDDVATQALLDEAIAQTTSCVDIGANRGEFLEFFTSRAPDGRHVAIEPIPALAEELRARFPSVEVAECALAEQEGSATFYWAVNDPGWSGLQVQEHLHNMEVEEITVQLKPLDAVISKPVDFIKIDVEGAELRVLGGASETLRQHRPVILFEHAITHAKAHGTTPTDVYTVLDEADYGIWSLGGRGPHSLTAFVAICEKSDASNYDRHAETNWVARPR